MREPIHPLQNSAIVDFISDITYEPGPFSLDWDKRYINRTTIVTSNYTIKIVFNSIIYDIYHDFWGKWLLKNSATIATLTEEQFINLVREDIVKYVGNENVFQFVVTKNHIL